MTNASTNLLLVDTNILAYIQDPTDLAKQAQASALVTSLISDGRAATTAQVLSEFFNTVTRKIPSPLSSEEAQERVLSITATFTVFDVTVTAVLEAIAGCTRHQMSYWDGLIWATAKLNNIGIVLTEDVRGQPMIERVRFLNPFDAAFDLSQIS
jgi:predicted nucleic acid-binding protein